MSNFNFEEYRQPWETGAHWELKREFMEKYQNDFPEDRLLCLAQAYSNMELLHCSYPDPVMLQVHELSKSLHECKRFREASKLKEEERNSSQRAQKGKRSLPSDDSNKAFKFIKFCSAATEVDQNYENLQMSDNISSSKNPTSDSNSSNKVCNNMDVADTLHMIATCKNNDNSSDFVLSLANSPVFKEIKALADKIKSNAGKQTPIEEIEKAVTDSNLENLVNFKFDTSSVEKVSMSFCKFYIGNTLISIGRDSNERNARIKAAEYAMEVLSNLCNLPCKTLSDLKTFWIGQNINYPFQHKNCCKEIIFSSVKSAKGTGNRSVSDNGGINEKGKYADKIDLQFWLNLSQEVKKCVGKNFAAIQILENAAKSVGISKDFYFNFNEELNSPLHSRIYCCNLVIEKTVLSRGKDSSKKKAKCKALENGVICLIDLIKWYEEHIESSSNVQENSKNSMMDKNRASMNSESKELTASTTNLADISNESNESSLLKVITDHVNQHTHQTASQESNLQLVKRRVTQRHKNSVKEERSLSKRSFDTLNSLLERKMSANGSIYPEPLNKKLLRNSYDKQVVLFDTSEIFPPHMQSPPSLLNYAASFCQKKMTYNTEEFFTASGETEKYRFHCLFDGEIIGTGEDPVKSEAKAIAAYSALENLRKTVYTIKVKNEVEEGFVITRNQVIDGDYSVNAVSDNNIGCKMLKMMGWSGGAIGKSGGITEPIVASDNNFHQGLGFKNTSPSIRSFKQKIEALLKDFSLSETTSDLIFSKDFSKEERKDIHKMALKLHLNSVSRGKDQNRQLFVKRKISLNELLDLVVQAGGSTSKYEMVDLSRE